MKKLLLFTVTLLATLSLAACGQKKQTTETAPSAKAQEIVAKHSDVRFKFNQITLAKADQDFKGGTNLATLKELFGEPVSHEQAPAGDVTLDVYTWQFDYVSLQVQLYEDNAIVRSISNFSFIRDPKTTLKTFEKITEGMTYTQAVDLLGEPDVLSQAVSSDSEELQALWISGLKTDSQAQIQLVFENNALKTKSQTGLAKK